MADRPRDVPDLYLAPVALELDARLAKLALLGPAQVRDYITVRTEHTPFSPEERRSGLAAAVTDTLDLRGWTVSWCSRGLRLAHGERTLVLGVHPDLAEYLDLGGTGDDPRG
jgi:hypothetical protein